MAENIDLGLAVTSTHEGNSKNVGTVSVPKDSNNFMAGFMAIYLPLLALIVILIELLIIIRQRRKLKVQSAQMLSNKPGQP